LALQPSCRLHARRLEPYLRVLLDLVEPDFAVTLDHHYATVFGIYAIIVALLVLLV
jgi:hypothetical protein